MTKRWLKWIMCVVLFGTGVLPSVAQDENNIGRTEADDENEEQEVSAQLGQLGPVSIPFALDDDCVATIGLYTTTGRLVRILGQALHLKKGSYTVRWDGLDLFGNVVPADTPLEVKIIANQPLRAFYEFSVSAPKVAPWSGRFDGKAGGWLADHSAPNSLAAAGDKLLIGSFLAEHGNNLIAVNLDGEKLWGTNLDGWTGPAALTADGKDVFALMRNRDNVVRVDPDFKEKRRSVTVYKSPQNPVHAFAARDGQLYLVKRNHLYGQSPFTVSLANGAIDYTKSRPQILRDEAATEFLIGPQTAWGNTFTSAGNPQNGAFMVVKNFEAFALVVFKEPVAIGTIVLGAVNGVSKAMVYTLKSDLVYDEKYSPLNTSADDPLDGMNLLEFSKEWVSFGETTMNQPVSLLTSKEDKLTTRAVLIRCLPSNAKDPNWKPYLQMARIMKERFVAVVSKPGWNLRTETPISAIYPAEAIVDLGKPEAMDGVLLLNCVSPDVFVDVRDPAGNWSEVGQHKGKYDKRLRHLSASKAGNEQYVHFSERVTAGALRFRHHSGYRSGKWGKGPDDGRRIEADQVVPVRLVTERNPQPTHLFEVYDVAGQKTVSDWRGTEYNIPALGFAPDGTLYCVASNRLCRTEVTGDGLKHQPLTEAVFQDVRSLSVSADRVAVGDAGRRAVLVFDRGGKLATTIGDKGVRPRGAWDPNVVERPSAVAIASDGAIWVAEELFAPKRVARYAADGKFIEEFLGPPMYGGGGCLDPNLKSFYYRSMEFELDWEKGTSRLKNLNDRRGSEESPSQAANSFIYTGIGQPLYFQGRRYILGENTISILDGATWRPCVAMGDANNNPFLLAKESWKRYWAKLELNGKLFIWCDQNDDGKYQVDEVELFDASAKPDLLNGLTVGPDLSLWGNAWRVKPSRISAAGVPIYRVADFQPFNYDQLAPHYSRNYTLGGPRSAKPHYNGFKYIASDGSLAQEGQPFVVLADGTIKGGAPTTQPSDYLPVIDGVVPQQPWNFAGGAKTKSAVGEVAVMNSNQGYWYVWGVDYGCLIGRFFTGETGGWGWGMPRQRGSDVTGRKHEWEGWGGHFIKADNGQYFATAGKGFHGISRIEGLDNFKVQALPVRVTTEQAKLAQRLRPTLKARAEAVAMANGKSTRQEVLVPAVNTRAPGFKLDGEIDDWGARHKFPIMGDPREKLVFDVAQDDRGLYLAFSGHGPTANNLKDWKLAFQAGFAFDLLVRADANNRSRDAVAGDRRLTIVRQGNEWMGVLYDYVAAGATAAEGLTFESPLAVTRIDRVTKLPAEAFKLFMLDDLLAMDELAGLGDAPTLPDAVKQKPEKPDQPWTAELFVPWSTLGLAEPRNIRFDVGIVRTGGARYWSNRYPNTTDDPALATMLNPGAWGSLRFQ